ncbi:MAG: hypothetical protein GF308_05770 [Candidatus Heimdallarchaeota archaeon]|nr:hypothetical protein [Candidatus Heimdallarchaeota archaeon]
MSKDKKNFSSNQSEGLSNNEWSADFSKTILAEMEEEKIQTGRKDIVIYKLKIQKVLQAVAIIVFIILVCDSLFYLTFWSPGSFGANWTLSWLMFIQSGCLLIISGITISQTARVGRRRNVPQGLASAPRINLKFAFFHSLTWFIAGILLAIFSYIVFYAIP